MDEQNTAERDMQLAEAAVNNAYFDYRWNTFCYNLIHKTRFSLNEDDLKFINEITSLLIKYFTVEAPIGSAFFRARIIDGHKLSVWLSLYLSHPSPHDSSRQTH